MRAIKFLGYANECNGIKVGMTLGGELHVWADGKNIVLFDVKKASELYDEMKDYYERIAER